MRKTRNKNRTRFAVYGAAIFVIAILIPMKLSAQARKLN